MTPLGTPAKIILKKKNDATLAMTAGFVDDVEDLVADIGRKTVVNILHHQDGIRTKASKNQNVRDAQSLTQRM